MFALIIEIISHFLHIVPFGQSGFIDYGDIMQFFIFFILIFLITKKEWLYILQLFIVSVIGLGIMFFSKYFLHTAFAKIAMRPNGDFDGFPSGHTTAAFIAAGFLWARYGFRSGILGVIAASFVGLSRIYAMRHTWLQVLCGAILGFFIAYIYIYIYISHKGAQKGARDKKGEKKCVK